MTVAEFPRGVRKKSVERIVRLENRNTMTMDLANRSFIHSLGIDSKNSNAGIDFESDPFSYIATERYTCKEFYGIMIDTGASKYSTAGYGQYLAYKKNHDDGIKINDSKAGAVNVQFGIGSTSSMVPSSLKHQSGG